MYCSNRNFSLKSNACVGRVATSCQCNFRAVCTQLGHSKKLTKWWQTRWNIILLSSNSTKNHTFGYPGGYLGPPWAPRVDFWPFLIDFGVHLGALWASFWHFFVLFCVFLLYFFRDRFLTGSGVHSGMILADFLMISGVIFFLVFCLKRRTENCVWTAPACTDCMSGVPEGHLFSCFFSHWFLDFL